jgi:hypothetical protein
MIPVAGVLKNFHMPQWANLLLDNRLGFSFEYALGAKKR